MNKLKIKVCGMKEPNNIFELAKLPIDYMGLIFYPQSPRYAGGLVFTALDVLPNTVKRVGVFVNESLSTVIELVAVYDLACIQLHGGESVEYCVRLKKELPSIELIKVFSVASEADLEQTNDFESICDYFLFDTKTPQHGGSGMKFDWTILDTYTGSKPFFLSGGISLSDAVDIKRLKHPQLYALDLNSRFELQAGVKDVTALDEFIRMI